MNARKVRKAIGSTMMIAGVLPLALFILLFPLFVLDEMTKEQWLEFGLFTIGLTVLVAVRMRSRSWLVFLSTLICVVIGYLSFCRFGTAQGILAGYGIHYDNAPDSPPLASSNLSKVRFWLNGPGGRLEGPSLIVEGGVFSVEKPYRTSDGYLEFAVRSRAYPDSPIRIQLISPPEAGQAFRVVKTGALVAMTYPGQPGISFP